MKPRKFRSQAEANVAQWLRQHGVKYGFETEKFKYTSPVKGGRCVDCGGKARKNRTYLLDFWIPDLVFGIEVKGRLGSSDRSKYRDIKECNPELDLRFLFLADNLIRRGRPERYSDWASQFGFPYSIKILDERWFKL